MAIKVVLADDHEPVRTGLREVFRQTEIEVVATAVDGLDAIQASRKFRPDVLIIDILMPHRDGLFALDTISREVHETRTLVYSMYDNPTYVARAITLGARDYLLKSEPVTELLTAVRRIAGEPGVEQIANQSGDKVSKITAPADVSKLVQGVRKHLLQRQRGSKQFASLTNRETQVLRHIAYGLSNREIGTSLRISVETVKEHVQNILRKVDVSDRTQAAVWAVRNELI